MFPSQLSITLVSQRVSVWTVLSKIASYRAHAREGKHRERERERERKRGEGGGQRKT